MDHGLWEQIISGENVFSIYHVYVVLSHIKNGAVGTRNAKILLGQAEFLLV